MKQKITHLIHLIKQHPYLTTTLLVVVFGFALYFVFTTKTSGPETIVVSRGSIIQEVEVTGKTKPSENVDLAFEKSGRITRVVVGVGARVETGTVLAQIDASDLLAQLQEAEGSVESQQAKLADLKKGARVEDIKAKEQELAAASQGLQNYYGDVSETLNDAYAKAEDAVRKQTDSFFSGDDENNPQLSFSTTNYQTKSDVESARIIAGQDLTAWKNTLSQLSPLSTTSELDPAITLAVSRLSNTRAFINKLNDALIGQQGLTSTTVDTYKSQLNTARASVNTALTTINTLSQNIASQKITVKRIENELALKKAGSTPEAIQAQEALVRQAEGNADAIRAQISKTVMRAPISGIVTKQDAKVGQISTIGTPVVSIISDSNLQIESNVPEVNIGNIQLGNLVHITLDAFSGEVFDGTVSAIDPAETIVDGVVNYKTTITFSQNDPKIKSGFTANLKIQTMKKDNVLILPQYAIVENDRGAFVKKMNGGNAGQTTEIPVTLGIRSQNGMVEIIDGVAEGDRVLNVGIKTK